MAYPKVFETGVTEEAIKPCFLAIREVDDVPEIVLVDEKGEIQVRLAYWDGDGDLMRYDLDEYEIKVARVSNINISESQMSFEGN